MKRSRHHRGRGTWRKALARAVAKAASNSCRSSPGTPNGPHHRGAHGYRLGDASRDARPRRRHLPDRRERQGRGARRRDASPSPKAPPSPTRPEACRWPPSRRNSPAGRSFTDADLHQGAARVDSRSSRSSSETPSAELRPELEAFARQSPAFDLGTSGSGPGCTWRFRLQLRQPHGHSPRRTHRARCGLIRRAETADRRDRRQSLRRPLAAHACRQDPPCATTSPRRPATATCCRSTSD